MTTEKLTFFERANQWLKNSIFIKLITIGILILLLLIPVSMVRSLIREREYRQKDAIREVSEKWGEKQTIKGPVLTIPYKTYTKVYEGEESGKYKVVETVEYAHFLPEKLNIEGGISPEVRYRGIYEVIVYNSKIKMSGHFSMPSFEEWKIKEENVVWEDAFISLGLSDLRSIQENIAITWDGESYAFNPGVETRDVIASGINAKIPLKAMADSLKSSYTYSLDLDFNGSSELNFIPLGKTTNVNLRSSWKSPSFAGAFLPIRFLTTTSHCRTVFYRSSPLTTGSQLITDHIVEQVALNLGIEYRISEFTLTDLLIVLIKYCYGCHLLLLYPQRLGLDSLADHDQTVFRSRHSTTHKDKVLFRTDFDYDQVLCRNSLVPHLSSHFFTFKNT